MLLLSEEGNNTVAIIVIILIIIGAIIVVLIGIILGCLYIRRKLCLPNRRVPNLDSDIENAQSTIPWVPSRVRRFPRTLEPPSASSTTAPSTPSAPRWSLGGISIIGTPPKYQDVVDLDLPTYEEGVALDSTEPEAANQIIRAWKKQ